MTEAQAQAALTHARLVLTDPGADDGTVRRQEPAAGTLVVAGSSVRIELGSPPPPSSPWLWVGLAGGAVLLAAVLVQAQRGRRRRARERRWVQEHLVPALEPGASRFAAPGLHVPTIEVHLEVRSGVTRSQLEEVGHDRE
jgi:hypothetical protein